MWVWKEGGGTLRWVWKEGGGGRGTQGGCGRRGGAKGGGH